MHADYTKYQANSSTASRWLKYCKRTKTNAFFHKSQFNSISTQLGSHLVRMIFNFHHKFPFQVYYKTIVWLYEHTHMSRSIFISDSMPKKLYWRRDSSVDMQIFSLKDNSTNKESHKKFILQMWIFIFKTKNEKRNIYDLEATKQQKRCHSHKVGQKYCKRSASCWRDALSLFG